jgi:hypothetical protein
MTHAAAHAAASAASPGTVHGYFTAHLKDPTKGAAARGDVLTVPGVVSAVVLDGAVVAIVELPTPPPHAAIPPADKAAHKRLDAVDALIMTLPPGATSYFDWVTHT